MDTCPVSWAPTFVDSSPSHQHKATPSVWGLIFVASRDQEVFFVSHSKCNFFNFCDASVSGGHTNQPTQLCTVSMFCENWANFKQKHHISPKRLLQCYCLAPSNHCCVAELHQGAPVGDTPSWHGLRFGFSPQGSSPLPQGFVWVIGPLQHMTHHVRNKQL